MQCGCSYVITDPKGELVKSCAQMFPKMAMRQRD